MPVVSIILLVLGFVGLIKGADIFVDGSSALARLANIPEVVIGLTIVALGTSAPELAVSVSAALQGSNEIAISNVTGSNLFNLLGMLGICALFKPLPVMKDILKRDYPLSILATAVLIMMIGVPAFPVKKGMDVGTEVSTLFRPCGLLLLVGFVIYIAALILQVMKSPREDGEAEVTGQLAEQPAEKKSLPVILLMILGGIGLIILGGEVVVNSARTLAGLAGMSETLIGLTIVAIGTSLPELVTSVVAARKGQTELAVGNVIGSNLFNILFILGVSVSIHPITVNLASLLDLCMLLFVSVLTYVFAETNKNINRMEGVVMVAIYALDMVWAAMRN